MSDEWYPDPLGRADLRRHDGARWTHDVSTDGVRSTERLGLPLPRREPTDAAVEPPPPATEAPPETPVRRAPSGGYRSASIPPAPYGPDVALGSFGLLIASGVLAILTGATTLFISISELSVISTLDQFRCTLLPQCSGSSSPDAGATFLAIVLMVLGIFFTAAGIGTCMARRSGRMALVVMSAISVLFYLVVFMVNQGNTEPFHNSGSVVLIPIIWFGLIGGMALVGGGIG